MIDLSFEGHRVADCKAKAIRRRGCGHVGSNMDITLSVDMRIHVAGEDTAYGHHHEKFDIDERVLALGVEIEVKYFLSRLA